MYSHERVIQLFGQKRYSELKKHCVEALKQDPLNNEAHIYFGYASVLLDDESGFESMQYAISEEPERSYYHYLNAHALHHVKNMVKALEAIKKAIEIDPHTASYHTFKGQLYSSDQLPNLAIESCNKALELDPDTHIAKALKAWCYLQKGEKKKAVALIKSTLQENPEDTYVNTVASYIYGHKNHFRKAREFTSFSLSKDPSNEAVQVQHLMMHRNLIMNIFLSSTALRVVSIALLVMSMFAPVVMFEHLRKESMPGEKALLFFRVFYYAYCYLILVGSQTMFLVLFTKQAVRKAALASVKSKLMYFFLFLLVSCVVIDLLYQTLWSIYLLIAGVHILLLVVSFIFIKHIEPKHRSIVFLFNSVIILCMIGFKSAIFISIAGGISFITVMIIMFVYVNLFYYGASESLGFKERKELNYA